MNSILFAVMIIACSIIWYLWRHYWCTCESKIIQIGKKAPDFILPDEEGKQHRLSEFLGKKVVLYFYPKDDTPGCTKQACSFRDTMFEYKQNNIVVIGISYDAPESHKAFKEKYQLPFILLSDYGKQIARAYGVAGALFVNRTTFLISESGIVVDRIDKVDVNNDARAIIDRFEKLKK